MYQLMSTVYEGAARYSLFAQKETSMSSLLITVLFIMRLNIMHVCAQCQYHSDGTECVSTVESLYCGHSWDS